MTARPLTGPGQKAGLSLTYVKARRRAEDHHTIDCRCCFIGDAGEDVADT